MQPLPKKQKQNATNVNVEKVKESPKKNIVSKWDLIQRTFDFITHYEWYRDNKYWDWVRYSIWYWTPANWRNTINKEIARQEVIDRIVEIQKNLEWLSDNQKIALTSFIYNLWPKNKQYLINETRKWNYKYVSNQIKKYVYSWDKKLKWLVNRRYAEAELYLK